MKIKGKSLALIIISIALIGGLIATLTLVKQKQENRSHATAATTLTFTPTSSSSSPISQQAGSVVTYHVMLNPGTNAVSFVGLDITYDATKFVDSATSFTPNKLSMPITLQGPIYSAGRIRINLSTGNDVTAVITTPVEIGTLSLTAQNVSATALSQIIFGSTTSVLSIAATDNSNENVLASSTPEFVNIVANNVPTPTQSPLTPTPTRILTLTPTPTNAPTPTRVSTLTPTKAPTLTPTRVPTPLVTLTPTTTILPTKAPTPTPTRIPTPTPTAAPLVTRLGFSLQLHGIGSSGDNANPTNATLSNKSPLHPSRQVSVLIYDETNTLIFSKIFTASYTLTGNFVGTVDLDPTFVTGHYNIKLKTDQFLRRLIPGIQAISAQHITQLPVVSMVSGDINNDNTLNILDYNTLIGCYSDFAPATSCNAAQKLATDLNDDGAVNQIDYNLFLRELSVQTGE